MQAGVVIKMWGTECDEGADSACDWGIGDGAKHRVGVRAAREGTSSKQGIVLEVRDTGTRSSAR